MAMPSMPHQSKGAGYPLTAEAAPGAVDWAPLPPPVSQLLCRSQRRVWLDVMLPLQPATSASTTRSPGALVTATLGTAPLPAFVAILRTGVVCSPPVKLTDPASTSALPPLTETSTEWAPGA